jgi:hypothetical protein
MRPRTCEAFSYLLKEIGISYIVCEDFGGEAESVKVQCLNLIFIVKKSGKNLHKQGTSPVSTIYIVISFRYVPHVFMMIFMMNLYVECRVKILQVKCFIFHRIYILKGSCKCITCHVVLLMSIVFNFIFVYVRWLFEQINSILF